MATGAASATRVHCQPGNRDQGNTDSMMDMSVSGTKNTRARISRRRSRRTAASSAASPAPGVPGGAASSAVSPAASTAPIRTWTGTSGGAVTRARSVARLTAATTPSSLFSFFWTRAAQAAQVIPPMTSSSSVTPAGEAVTATGDTVQRIGSRPWNRVRWS